MSNFYSDLIQVRPGYESVVKIESDADNYWKGYIVNDDMVEAIKLISKSLKRADPTNDSWHFIIEGTYGTGKTYSALVIKHLLEDNLEDIKPFLSHPLFADIKDKFVGIRKTGNFIVSWKSGEAKKLNTTDKLLLELERTIKASLKSKDYSYFGSDSLIDSIKTRVSDHKGTLREDFDNEVYEEFFSIYDSIDEFISRIDVGDRTACDIAAEYFSKKSIHLATDLDTFKAWIQDIFKDNPELNNTGLFIIWDEFSEYVRGGNDLEILQELSQLSQLVPFYILYVIHTYSADDSIAGAGEMRKIKQRFHTIHSSLTEATTFKLIGESIMPIKGMEHVWKDISNDMYSAIQAKAHDLLPEDAAFESDTSDLVKLFPIHPMTVNLMSKIAGKFSGSSRSVFRFLKDEDVEEQEAGFRHFIKNNGPNNWKWITPDYLWEYFFIKGTRDADSLNLSKDALECIRHYKRYENQITSEAQMRVFKTVLLLKATVDTSHIARKSFYSNKKNIRAALSTLVDCYYGQLEKNDIETYLKALNEQKILLVTPDKNDYRIGLPYLTDSGEFETELNKIKEKYTPHALLDSTGNTFGEVLKRAIISGERAVSKRLVLETCWGSKNSINIRATSIKDALSKQPHKFGVLLIAIGNIDDIQKIEPPINILTESDETDRLVICVIRTPLDKDKINNWYECKTNAVLASKGNNPMSAKTSDQEATDLVNGWVQSAIGHNMTMYYKNDVPFSVANNNQLAREFEKIVFRVFPHAPEAIIKTATAYGSGSASIARLAIAKIDNKDDDGAYNARIENIVDIFKEHGLWEKDNPDVFTTNSGNKIEDSVGSLVKFFSKELEESAVYLDDLWDNLQARFGYYDTMVCRYLIGFAMQFYSNKGFTWYDGSVSHPLDDNTLATMINFMCKGSAIGHKMAKGSKVERQFIRLLKEIFKLSDNEAGDIELTRKNIKPKIDKIGFPFWVIKYSLDDQYQGHKEEIISLIDKIHSFILQDGDQQVIIEDVVVMCRQKGKVYRQIIERAYHDKAILVEGMKNYMFHHSADISIAYTKYGFKLSDIFGLLRDNLPKELWQWTEMDVAERLPRLLLDIKLVGIVNELLGTQNKTIEKTTEDLGKPFRFMKVPGAVYENNREPWSNAVHVLHEIAMKKWVSYSFDEKEQTIALLEDNAFEAWHHIKEPKEVLGDYVKCLRINLADAELTNLLSKLPTESYVYSENSFRANVKSIYRELDYAKKLVEVKKLWKSVSGCNTIAEWCNSNGLPIVWLLPKHHETFQTLRQIDHNERVDFSRIDVILNELINSDFSLLKDKQAIYDCLISKIASVEYHDLLITHYDRLIDYFKKNVLDDVYLWSMRPDSLRLALHKYIKTKMKDEVVEKAKGKLANLGESEIRKLITNLLDENTDLCLNILRNW